MGEVVNIEAIISPFQVPKEVPIFAVYKVLSQQYELDQTLSLMEQFCLQAKDEENQRKGLEFLYMTGRYHACKSLLKINETSENELNRQYGRIYRIVLERKTNYNDPNEILEELKEIPPLNQEVRIIKLFLKLYAHVDLNQYEKIGNQIEALSEEFRTFRDPFLTLCYQERMDEAFFVYHLSKNELILCRKYAFKVLNRTFNPNKKWYVHNILSLTYAFDSYEQAMYHSNEALQVAREHGNQEQVDGVLHHNIPFISALNGRPEGINTPDPTEQAHLAIAKGDYQTAIDILQPIQDRSPFQNYYLGKATEDQDLLHKALKEFKRQGHHLFARLPLRELNKSKQR